MEVKSSPLMDQLLVNTAAQAPASQSAKPAKDEDRPTFDSMVTQKRAEKPQPKAEKTAEKPEAKPTDAKAAEDTAQGAVVTDGQYAVAAAMLLQVQPESFAAAPVQTEQIAVQTVDVVETVQTVDAAAEAPMPEVFAAQEETAQPLETADVTVDTAPAAPAETQQRTDKTADEPHAEAPIEAKREAPAQPREAARSEQRETAPETDDAPRTQRSVETPRFVRSEEPVEDEPADGAQAAQATPLFERVEATPVKVAQATHPIPLEAEDGVEQLGREIGGVLINSADANRIAVTLTPENLGRITVEISRGENGVLSVVLHPSTERAANLLERHTGDLQNALMASTRSETQVQVRPAEESQQQYLDPNGQNEQQRQQQQQQRQQRQETQSAQDFLQQLRLGLVDVEKSET